ncbi:hypothetical protein scyTo_0007948 [Scyliorhinus torazame]|uniref:Secreted protein n=1 Tax=Scyliorhinus torazame TaxID=75743 RepID=A0A401P169_SCYTO|nr:hypothetical protein [Scyliorhinus torazame]
MMYAFSSLICFQLFTSIRFAINRAPVIQWDAVQFDVNAVFGLCCRWQWTNSDDFWLSLQAEKLTARSCQFPQMDIKDYMAPRNLHQECRKPTEVEKKVEIMD